MRIKSTLGALALCCLSLAVPRPTFGQAAADAAAKKPLVKLLGAGNGPKQALRYKLTKGTTETVAMDMNMSMKMSVGGQQLQAMDLPTMTMRMKVETAEVLPNGDAKLTMEFVDSDVAEKPGVPPEMVQQMRQAMQRTKGLKGTATITAQGETKDAKFDVPADADPQTKQSVQQAEQQMSQLAAPLPAQAVGTGGKWEVTTQMESQGMKLNQTATYTLKELRADGATFDIAIKQSAPAGQAVQGGQATLQKMESTGTATSKIQFGKVVPVASTANIDLNMVMAPAAGAGNGNMNMDMKMTITMKPADEKK